ncbi:DUF2877 domain-containing protein [Atlantibacter hermannii]|uniref:DUF2877 domain-containing protein n=1 Tax=Atlantibacter hermannii TaxID=565 RepID=UPI0028ABFABA|nr:DUF2877 domain-containing protein [Atlantibacter hermannii]
MSGISSQTPSTFTGIVMCDTVVQHLSGAALTVHSVFHHACNLTTPDNHLLTLLTQDAPLAPGAVRMRCADFRPLFSVGETVRPQDDRTYAAAGCRMMLTSVPCQSTCVPEDAILPSGLSEALDAFLPVTAPEYGIWNNLHSRDRRLTLAVRQLTQWLEDDATPAPGEALKTLIGAGAGLTPSGDDFLLGMLFVMNVTRHRRFEALASAIDGLLSRTTDISRAMLQYGSSGHFGEQLLALTASGPLSLNARLLRVAAYGHSSGHDMLTGILFTLRALSGQRL